MSTVTPFLQARNGHPRDWGNHASADVLPNASASPYTAAQVTPLEEGDTATVIGVGQAQCMSPGTPGSNDAVWRITLASASIFVPVAATTIAGSSTSPVAYGAVYLAANTVVQASSRALVGVIGSGTATVQVRRQSTGVLVGGLSWSTISSLNNQSLGLAVTIAADDWYTFEIVSSADAALALVQGVELKF